MKHLIICSMLLSSIVSFAQPHFPGDDHERREKIEAIKVAFITEELDLTVAESQNFWPIYNELQKKEIELREAQRSTLKTLQSESSDQELEKAMYTIADGHIALEELRKSYIDDFISVLGAQKTAQLFKAEREFGRRIMERMRRSDRPKDGGPRKDGPREQPGRPMR